MSTNDTTVVLNSGWQIICAESDVTMFAHHMVIRDIKIEYSQVLMVSGPSGEVWYG